MFLQSIKDREYNLFISHSWSYSDKYEGLVSLLERGSSFCFKNYSIPKDDPVHTNGTDEELYEAIKSQMSYASVVLILAGVYASYSRWINNEIYIAKNEFYIHKPIIAVEYWGAERTSRVVKENADMVVKWNSNSVIQAIKKLG